ncbi:MAG: LapA family protein [Calditrichaeota bacterium]|nr:MAG: LapA family protein [Calditrichota bacterium]
MWIVRWVFTAIIVLFILGFALQNTAEQVSVVLIKGSFETGPLPIWIVVYISFALGVVFWLFMSIFQVFALKTDIRKANLRNSKLRKELDNLRNLSIESDIELLPAPENKPDSAKPEK